MNRRDFMSGSAAAVISTTAFAQTRRDLQLPFDQLLDQTVEAGLTNAAGLSRDSQSFFLDELEKRGIQRRERSTRKISDRAMSLIVAFEVTSQSAYERRYRRPIWPQGASGVTVGIGYDIGYVTKAWLKEDWSETELAAAQISAMEPACGVKGTAAQAILPTIVGVDIPWNIALTQFKEYVLPRYVSETIAALPNSNALSDDSLGALVSLTYNRGSAYSQAGDRYAEMRSIRRHMEYREFDQVAGDIRAMKRIWADQGLPGLLYRRELEAKLFEQGL